MRPIARSILAEVSRLATDVRLWDMVLLVGGGGPLIAPVMSHEFGIPVRLARDPEYANAAGYFKHRLKLR